MPANLELCKLCKEDVLKQAKQESHILSSYGRLLVYPCPRYGKDKNTTSIEYHSLEGEMSSPGLEQKTASSE